MVLKIAAVFLSLTAGAMLAEVAAAAADRGMGDRAPGDPSVTVRYSHAELATPQGAELLYAKLRLAAQQACPGVDAFDPMRAVPGRACYDEALAAAVARIQQSQLTALHKRKSAAAIKASRGA